MDPKDQFSPYTQARRRNRTFKGVVTRHSQRYTSVRTGADVLAPRTGLPVCAGGQQTTWDIVHPKWHAYTRSTKNKANRDIGGHFFSEKRYIQIPPVSHLLGFRTGGIHESFDGVLFPDVDSGSLATQIASGTYPAIVFTSGTPVPTLRARGATAISRTIPTDPAVNVATSIGELTGGLPSMIGTAFKKHGVKGAGDEYLNYQFGISPMVSDLKSLKETYAESEKILAQWYRDSGRRVRRRYSFPDEVSETSTVLAGKYPFGAGGSPSANIVSHGTLTTTTNVVRKTWFSGSYTYHVPKYADEWMRKTAEFNRLYGVIPNVDTAWNLIPWSWLVDYKTNAGDVMKNISYLGKDGLVLTHGYIMSNTITTVTKTWEGNVAYAVTKDSTGVLNTTLWKRHRVTSRIVTDNKMRLRANPYGIGFTGESLNNSQLAILAALGISKGKHRIP